MALRDHLHPDSERRAVAADCDDLEPVCHIRICRYRVLREGKTVVQRYGGHDSVPGPPDVTFPLQQDRGDADRSEVGCTQCPDDRLVVFGAYAPEEFKTPRGCRVRLFRRTIDSEKGAPTILPRATSQAVFLRSVRIHHTNLHIQIFWLVRCTRGPLVNMPPCEQNTAIRGE